MKYYNEGKIGFLLRKKKNLKHEIYFGNFFSWVLFLRKVPTPATPHLQLMKAY